MPSNISEISLQIMKNNDYYSPQKFHSFLKEKGIEESHWADIVLYIINKVKDEREKGLLIFTIGMSVNQFVTNVDRFMLKLEAIEDQYHDFNRIHDLLTDLDIDLVRMKDLYQKFEHSDISAFLSYRTSSLLLLLDMSYISMIAN